MAHSPSEIIDAYGGASAFADALAEPVTNVRLWKHRNRIPRRAWPEISVTFPELTTEKLLEIERRADGAAA